MCIASWLLRRERLNVLRHIYTTRRQFICAYPVSEGLCDECKNIPKATPHIQNDLPDVLQTSMHRGCESHSHKSALPGSPLQSLEVSFDHPSDD